MRRRDDTASSLPTPPRARGLRQLGETLEFLRSPEDFVARRRALHGPMFSAQLFGAPTVFMTGAEANRWIYSGEGKVLENQWLPATRKLLGQDSLALVSGSTHKHRRKHLGPYFARANMAQSIPGIVEITRKHLRRWSTDAQLGPLAIAPRMRALAFEVAANFLLGDASELGVGLDEFSREFTTWTAGMFAPVPAAIPGSKFAKAVEARTRMFAWLGDLVDRRRASERRGPDVLSTLLDLPADEAGARGAGGTDSRTLSRDTIVDEIQLLLFAGHDTSVTGLTNVVYHLAKHPDVMATARAEQDRLDERSFTGETLRSMSYLDAVIKESLRLIPPIGGAFRVMLTDAEFGGFRIPRGWRIAVGPRSVHWEPEYYATPDRFEPERWLDAAERPPFSYIPFGGGPRVCLGMHFAMVQMQVVLALLLRDFEWRLLDDQDLSFTQIPMPLPRSGLLVDLLARPGV